MTRAEFCIELDQMLAALRRMILKAANIPLDVMIKTIDEAAPVERAEVPPDVTVNDITVRFDPPSVIYLGKSIDLARRQAQLMAVLLNSMNAGSLPRARAGFRAWPDLTDNSKVTRMTCDLPILTRRLEAIGIKLVSERGYGLRLVIEGQSS